IKNEINTAIQSKTINRYVLGALYKDTEGLLYGFNKKDKTLQFNPSAYKFLLKFQEVIFRQSRNESYSNEVIINHIENITKRKSLTEYRELLLTYSESRCFYTNATLVKGKSKKVVDHFISWSFVHGDNLWNFVLTTPSLNSRKDSKLPSNEYINKLFQRNDRITKVTDQTIREEFAEYKKSTVEKLYAYAGINGFPTGWTP
ncbi:hypothetical protein J4G37_38655, partial [Microvirga sp. 3-52]|nr:hypothetical protein [Microvirga sp. 3-52]